MTRRDGSSWWLTRLRWRLRGASMWPAFFAAIVVDAALLALLPIAGDGGPGLVAAVLLAGFLNLALVAAGAPLAGRWLRRRRPSLPQVVAGDRAGTALMGALAVTLLVLGLVHRPAVADQDADLRAQAASARRFVLAQAPTVFRANVDRMETVKQGPDLYRTCVPGSDPVRSFCVFVTTDQHPPGVSRDPDQTPNAVYSGPDGPGRQ